MTSQETPLRLRIKTFAFLAAPWLFRRTRAYAYWNSNLLAGRSFDDWIRRRERPQFSDQSAISAGLKRLAGGPRFRLVIPVGDLDEGPLRKSIGSVRGQSYKDWSLSLVVRADSLAAKNPDAWLQSVSDGDPRIDLAAGDRDPDLTADPERVRAQWCAIIGAGDQLAKHALYFLAKAASGDAAVKVIYTDEDRIDELGKRQEPRFKPDWNPDLFYSRDYVSQLVAFREDLLRDAGLVAAAIGGSPDPNLLLRCLPHLEAAEIAHVPWILYHRLLDSARHMGTEGPPRSGGRNRKEALEDFFRVAETGTRVEQGLSPDSFRVRFAVPCPEPLVTLLVPTRDRLELVRGCVQSILERTSYQNYEILIIDNQSREPETLSWFEAVREDPRVRVLGYDRPFNFSAINNHGVSAAGGEVLGLINNDIEVISPDWLGEMVSHACRPDIGCVGAKLYYGDGRVQHAGILLGIRNGAAHAHRLALGSDSGYCGRLRVVQNLSAVTAACLVVRREVYQELGGLDERNLAVDFNDVDFCLRALEAGYRNLWTPYAELYHRESASRGTNLSRADATRHAKEQGYLVSRWGAYLDRDPAYNPNLTRYSEDFSLG